MSLAAVVLSPRLPIIGVVLAITTAFALAILGPAVGGRSPAPTSHIVAERTLRFLDRPDGAVVVQENGAQVAVFQGEQGFLRGILRSLVRMRHGTGLPAATPFHLAAYDDGRLTIDDPATGQRVELEAFGSTNVAVFATLLPVVAKPASYVVAEPANHVVAEPANHVVATSAP